MQKTKALGLGSPATYADTISRLYQSGLASLRDGGEVVATPLGQLLIQGCQLNGLHQVYQPALRYGTAALVDAVHY